MAASELQRLADDIAAHGQREPIALLDGLVLDGRCRLRACQLAGLAPSFIEADLRGQLPVEFVLSRNLRRRHLNTVQLALLALDLIPFYTEAALARKHRGRGGLLPEQEAERGHTDVRVARIVGISADTVRKVTAIAHRDPEVIEMMRRGAFESVRAATLAAGIEPRRAPVGQWTSGDDVDRWRLVVPPLASYLRRWIGRPLDHLAPQQARARLRELELVQRGIDELAEQLRTRARG